MKLQNLKLENFRGFDHFATSDLGRVNLLVGTNNSGKTTVLEAAYILMSSQKLLAIWTILTRRGEISSSKNRELKGRSKKVAEVIRLFQNHEIFSGSFFRISAGSDTEDLEFWAFADPRRDTLSFPKQLGFLDHVRDSIEDSLSMFSLKLEWNQAFSALSNRNIQSVPLGKNGGLSLTALRDLAETDDSEDKSLPVRFLTASPLTSDEVLLLYDEIVLTPQEDLIVEVLKIIEPKVERIASIGSNLDRVSLTSRGDILVRLEGNPQRIPIASMGEGMWRLLGLGLAAIHCSNGVLLVDEIDTGLHYSVMGKMWRFLNECSKQFNVQIIATTHSRDCYQSLAEICREDQVDQSEVTIQRIDRTRAKAVAYSEAAIIAAAENDVEVR